MELFYALKDAINGEAENRKTRIEENKEQLIAENKEKYAEYVDENGICYYYSATNGLLGQNAVLEGDILELGWENVIGTIEVQGYGKVLIIYYYKQEN